MSSRDDTYQILAETLHIPAGVTVAIPALPYETAIQLKYISGGSLSILGSTFTVGVTNYGGGSYVASMRYILGTTEVFAANMSGTLYIQGSGSTCVASLVRTFSASVI